MKKQAFVLTTTLLVLFGSHAFADNEYMVEKGDSLSKIGQLLGVPWQEIMKANNLTSTVIHPNQILIIPSAGKIYSTQIPTPSAVVAPKADPAPLTVPREAQDKSLVKMASNDSTHKGSIPKTAPVPQPPTVNDPKLYRSYSDAVYIPPIQGNRRARPAQESEIKTKTYTVKKGDTIWDISQLFDLSLKEIQEPNGLNSSKIYPGQLLLIPIK